MAPGVEVCIVYDPKTTPCLAHTTTALLRYRLYHIGEYRSAIEADRDLPPELRA